MAQKAPVRILITGAAGQIAYSLIFSIAKGDFLGKDQPVILHLLDIEPMLGVLNGVVMEIEDGAFELLRGVVPTTDPNVAFQDVDYVLMVGAMPRKAGMERKDLLKANAGIFKVQGKALNERAKKDVRVLVVGNPANTNCLIMCKNAPDIPKTSFSALTRLDHNRAKAQIAMRLGTNPKNVKNVAIWGNHSATQYPDVSHGVVMNFPKDGMQTPIEQAVNDEAWLHGDFIKTIQQRGAAVIKARQLSSAASAAKAIVDHMRDWIVGTAEGEWVSMGLYTDGKHYGIPEGLIFSFPVTCKDRQYKVVEGLSISPFSQTMLNATLQELQGEEGDAKEFFAQIRDKRAASGGGNGRDKTKTGAASGRHQRATHAAHAA